MPLEAAAAVAALKKTFVLKDGRKLVAQTAVGGGDVWSIKTEDGKLETIAKDTAEKILEA